MRVIVVSTGLLINESRTKILLLKRKQVPYVGWWSFPGGKTEAGETLLNAVQREVMEETGGEMKNPRLCVLLNERLYRDGEVKAHFFINYWYGVLEEGNVISQDTREGEIKWFSFEELPQFIVPSDKRVLDYCCTRRDGNELMEKRPVFIEGVLNEVEDPGFPGNTRLDILEWEIV